ncbi:putative baseplate assembly protein [Bradyrhizobium guangdongense]|uniref:putative baseplate assembly protein n=1 Tax=Bradyrhizobium guangdongense TaxID=1325090 RepID=UPI00112C236B|nr:putative baseplate assembly protein [Bradyrhizobium guangdongense]TPQ34845.1 putative baseplate assembly protein [Bradyrhizobium guangdongense]
MIFHCCDELRRDKVAAHPTLNGIDYLEVIDHELPLLDPLRQRTLLVYCLKPLPAGFSRGNVVLTGGERVKNITVEWAAVASPLPAQLSAPGEAATSAIVAARANPKTILVVRVDEPGDFSTYTLRFVASALDSSLPPNFDPQFAAIDFSFKVECPSDFDCKPVCQCPEDEPDEPDIDYLAKDYGSFRRLLLDRMSQLVPQWRQSSVADTGIALVELLSYVGDHLSYQQDAIATEAYLDTARRRISLRRHALLVDYPMHDGCNARVWIQIQVDANSSTLTRAGTQFLTRCPGFARGIASGSNELKQALLLAPTVFEPLRDPGAPTVSLYKLHNKISFYTWGDERCCLPRGATSATLAGSLPNLKAGDVLLFEEVLGPHTGLPGDADPGHRHVVRLTSVSPTPPATLTDPLTNAAITEITWGQDDALPFPLCISAVTDEAHGSKTLTDVSVARGNMVLADHGRTLAPDPLGSVPAPTLFVAPDQGCDGCSPSALIEIPVRFRPFLQQAPLTQAATVSVVGAGQSAARRRPFDPTASATSNMDWDMSDVLPQITLSSLTNGTPATWQSHRTLLNSAADANDFVVEVDDDGGAALRFGDDDHGVRPEAGTEFSAVYRIGNGTAGNVGGEAIFHIVAAPGEVAAISAVRNPLPAAGGVDPETADDVRRNAPEAFRRQERAVTPEDYAEVTERFRGVQRAAVTTRWTGSWYTQFISVDPIAGVDPHKLSIDLLPFVDRYRMAGEDLEFNDPHYVSLELKLNVCVQPDYFRADVKARLLDALSNRVLPDGRRGLFHPDNFSFGDSVYLSEIYATAHAVPGVASAQIVTFQRQGTNDPTYLAAAQLPIGRLEIARLENSLNFPEHGVLRLALSGGK